jgi:hypothetical protein
VPCCQSLRLSQFHACPAARAWDFLRFHACPAARAWDFLRFHACPAARAWDFLKFMHALLPEPETFSIPCMPCCQSLRLSQFHACPAARAWDFLKFHACPAARAWDFRNSMHACCQSLRLSQFHACLLPEPETFSISCMPCCQSLRLSQFHACPAARAWDFLKFMHALLPEPETFSNSCMPCCQSLRLSQIHACPAARAWDFLRFHACPAARAWDFLNFMHALLPEPETFSNFMHALLPEPETFSISCMPCCQSLRLSQIHACPAARAWDFLNSMHALLPEPETFSNSMHALLPEPETFSISCMPCCQSLRLSQFHACPAARAWDFLNFMHALLPEPETFSISCMPCCQSLRLSQFHACPAARAWDFLNFMHALLPVAAATALAAARLGRSWTTLRATKHETRRARVTPSPIPPRHPLLAAYGPLDRSSLPQRPSAMREFVPPGVSILVLLKAGFFLFPYGFCLNILQLYGSVANSERTRWSSTNIPLSGVGKFRRRTAVLSLLPQTMEARNNNKVWPRLRHAGPHAWLHPCGPGLPPRRARNFDSGRRVRRATHQARSQPPSAIHLSSMSRSRSSLLKRQPRPDT